jgi:hypothetical protein
VKGEPSARLLNSGGELVAGACAGSTSRRPGSKVDGRRYSIMRRLSRWSWTRVAVVSDKPMVVMISPQGEALGGEPAGSAAPTGGPGEALNKRRWSSEIAQEADAVDAVKDDLPPHEGARRGRETSAAR